MRFPATWVPVLLVLLLFFPAVTSPALLPKAWQRLLHTLLRLRRLDFSTNLLCCAGVALGGEGSTPARAVRGPAAAKPGVAPSSGGSTWAEALAVRGPAAAKRGQEL